MREILSKLKKEMVIHSFYLPVTSESQRSEQTGVALRVAKSHESLDYSWFSLKAI